MKHSVPADLRNNNMTDIQSFVDEIMSFLTEDDISELEEKAGIRFPLKDMHWSDLCFVCCWMAMKRDLPDTIHNRMILGESNGWSDLYVRVLRRRAEGEKFRYTLEDLFTLAG